jgi:CrcB protein
MTALYVALGGASGALVRWLVQIVAARQTGTPLTGTIAVNVIGCLLIGLLAPLLPRLHLAVPPLVVVGFLGGMTTMSGYTLESWKLATEGRWQLAACYAGGAVMASLLACGAGLWLGQKLA